MNTQQRIMAEFNQQSAGMPQKTYQLGKGVSQPALSVGRAARSLPKMAIGLAGFWFGEKKPRRQS
jgi:hypothetical protein